MASVGQSKKFELKTEAPKQPVVQPPKDVVMAAFTPRELDAMRTICRDSDNETATRTLNAALARAGK